MLSGKLSWIIGNEGKNVWWALAHQIIKPDKDIKGLENLKIA
ncbi:MAG: hypothetical protein WCG95_07285 [bacterium]